MRDLVDIKATRCEQVQHSSVYNMNFILKGRPGPIRKDSLVEAEREKLTFKLSVVLKDDVELLFVTLRFAKALVCYLRLVEFFAGDFEEILVTDLTLCDSVLHSLCRS